MKYFPEIFFSNFGTKQKLHLFVFFLLGIERKSFPEEKISFLEEEFSRKKQEIARFTNNQTFSPTIHSNHLHDGFGKIGNELRF